MIDDLLQDSMEEGIPAVVDTPCEVPPPGQHFVAFHANPYGSKDKTVFEVVEADQFEDGWEGTIKDIGWKH